MSWIKIEHGLCKSRKIAKLSAAMGWSRHQAIGFMVDFWIWAAQSCDDGQLKDITDSEIAFAAGLEKADGILIALISAGFLDAEPLRIHQWAEHQAEFLRSKYRRSPEQHQKIQSLYRTSTEPVPELSRNKQASKQDKQLPMPKPAAPVFVLPDWVDPTAWADYVAMRVKIRKPMTDRAKALAIGDLNKLRAQGHDPKLVLESSILNSWAGVFPLKPGQMQSSRPKAPPKPMTAREKAIAEGRWDNMTPAQREALIEAEA